MTNQLEDKIVFLLKEYPDLVSNDMYLASMIWRSEIGEEAHAKSCFVLLGKLARHELTTYDVIMEAKRKVIASKLIKKGERS